MVEESKSIKFNVCHPEGANFICCLYMCILVKVIYNYTSTDYAKSFDCVDHNKLGKILTEMGIPDHLTCLLRNLYAGQEATVRIDMEQTGSKSGKEYVKAVYCHPAYLTYMQRTS